MTEAPKPAGSCPTVTVPDPIARRGDPGAVVPSTPWSVRPHVSGEEAGKGEIAPPAGTGPNWLVNGAEDAVKPELLAAACAAWAAAIRPWMALISC